MLLKLSPLGTAFGLCAVGLIFLPSANAAVLIKQEFEGIFSLLSASPLLEGTLPEFSEYSGFVTYEQNGTLNGWEINVNELDLTLNPEFAQGDIVGDIILFPPATINFEFSSPLNWELSVDFGIAFDAPRYTLQRTPDSEIKFIGEVGLAGVYVYNDPNPNITLTASSVAVPEPVTVLGTVMVCGVGAAFLKKKHPG